MSEDGYRVTLVEADLVELGQDVVITLQTLIIFLLKQAEKSNAPVPEELKASVEKLHIAVDKVRLITKRAKKGYTDEE